MKYLLDTHILLWMRLDTSRLSLGQQRLILDRNSVKLISAISIWEISLKFGLGKLDLGGQIPETFVSSAQKLGLEIVTPSVSCYASFHNLPAIVGHKDPFDRLLIWQAMHDNFSLLSSDSKFAAYKPTGLRLA